MVENKSEDKKTPNFENRSYSESKNTLDNFSENFLSGEDISSSEGNFPPISNELPPSNDSNKSTQNNSNYSKSPQYTAENNDSISKSKEKSYQSTLFKDHQQSEKQGDNFSFTNKDKEYIKSWFSTFSYYFHIRPLLKYVEKHISEESLKDLKKSMEEKYGKKDDYDLAFKLIHNVLKEKNSLQVDSSNTGQDNLSDMEANNELNDSGENIQSGQSYMKEEASTSSSFRDETGQKNFDYSETGKDTQKNNELKSFEVNEDYSYSKDFSFNEQRNNQDSLWNIPNYLNRVSEKSSMNDSISHENENSISTEVTSGKSLSPVYAKDSEAMEDEDSSISPNFLEERDDLSDLSKNSKETDSDISFKEDLNYEDGSIPSYKDSTGSLILKDTNGNYILNLKDYKITSPPYNFKLEDFVNLHRDNLLNKKNDEKNENSYVSSPFKGVLSSGRSRFSEEEINCMKSWVSNEFYKEHLKPLIEKIENDGKNKKIIEIEKELRDESYLSEETKIAFDLIYSSMEKKLKKDILSMSNKNYINE